MITYTKMQDTYSTYNGWIQKYDSDAKRTIQFNEDNEMQWQQYQDWIAEGNTPEDQYPLDTLKQTSYEYADQLYEQALKEPVNDGTDDIDVGIEAKSKIHNAKATGRTSIKVKRKNGKAKTYTDTELDDLLDAIEDRDDAALDTLDSTYDAIEAATTFEELEPYLPPLP